MSSRVLVLGANGFIGSNLCQTLLCKGYDVTGFDITIPAEKDGSIRYVQGDFFDNEILFAEVAHTDYLIHALGVINPSNSNSRYQWGYDHELMQTISLFDRASREQVKTVYISSGGTVYGDGGSSPIDENTVPVPINHYGALKLCAETAMRAFSVQTGTSMFAARLANPYGPGQDSSRGVGFIDAAIRRGLTGRPVEIWGDGSTVRDYIFIDDASKMITELLQYEGPDSVFNVSSGIGRSQRDIIALLESMGLDLEVSFLPARSVDAHSVVLANERIRQIYTDPLTPIYEGLRFQASYLYERLCL